MRKYSSRKTASWEFQGVQETPFAYSKWIERPIVALFKHVARDEAGTAVEGFQCCYPNIIGYHQDELSEIQASPVGHYKHGMAREELDRAVRLLDAAATFKTASESDLEALLAKKKDAEVIMFVPSAERLQRKFG